MRGYDRGMRQGDTVVLMFLSLWGNEESRPYIFIGIGYALFAEISKSGFFGYARSLEANRMGLRKFKENLPDTFLLYGVGITAQQRPYRAGAQA